MIKEIAMAQWVDCLRKFLGGHTISDQSLLLSTTVLNDCTVYCSDQPQG